MAFPAEASRSVGSAPEAQSLVIGPDLLSQTAAARRMGVERFKHVIKMAERADVQARFNGWFPNVANDPESQKRYESMREDVFEGDELDCYDLLREAYGRPKLVDVYDAKSEAPLDRTTITDTQHPLEDPSTFIG
jgi:hypothetical protein